MSLNMYIVLNFNKLNSYYLYKRLHSIISSSQTDSPVAESEAALAEGRQSLAQRENFAESRQCCTLCLGPSPRTEIHPA